MELQNLFTESKYLNPVPSTVISKSDPTRAFSAFTIGKWAKKIVILTCVKCFVSLSGPIYKKMGKYLQTNILYGYNEADF